MEVHVLKKVYYFGLGCADLFLENFNKWAEKGAAYLEKMPEVELEVIVVDSPEDVADEAAEDIEEVQTEAAFDDLTTIRYASS